MSADADAPPQSTAATDPITYGSIVAALKAIPTETHLPDLQAIARARTSAEILRYVAGGLIAGGVGVVLAMLVAGGPLGWRSYIALDVIYGVLLVAMAVFSWRMLVGPIRKVTVLANLLIPGFGVLLIAISSATESATQHKAVQPYTNDWWVLVATALTALLIGCQKRFHADRQMHVLPEYEALRKRWEKQQKKIAKAIRKAHRRAAEQACAGETPE